ncbi:hypothetical protein [Thalassobacillus sp. C254]|nr:hypothetical protein [Thalassobacillus sp. C254]
MDEVLKEVYHSITKRKSPALPEVSLPEKETKGQKQLVFCLLQITGEEHT